MIIQVGMYCNWQEITIHQMIISAFKPLSYTQLQVTQHQTDLPAYICIFANSITYQNKSNFRSKLQK